MQSNCLRKYAKVQKRWREPWTLVGSVAGHLEGGAVGGSESCQCDSDFTAHQRAGISAGGRQPSHHITLRRHRLQELHNKSSLHQDTLSSKSAFPPPHARVAVDCGNYSTQKFISGSGHAAIYLSLFGLEADGHPTTSHCVAVDCGSHSTRQS